MKKVPIVRVRNLNKKYRLSESFIQRIARDMLVALKAGRVIDLDVVFLSNGAIRSFNKRYKHADRATDVLSFDLGPCAQILISSDAASKNSKIFDTRFEEEIVLYVIHGILHLHGYDDGTKAEKNRMSKREDRILKGLCGRLKFSKVLTRR